MFAKSCALLSLLPWLLAAPMLHAQADPAVQTDKGTVIGKLADDGQASTLR